MIFLKIKLSNFGYSYEYASNIEMSILCSFLSSDIGYDNSGFKRWAMANKFDSKSEFTWTVEGNITFLEEKEDGCIYISSNIPLEEGEEFVEFKIAKEQFIKLLDYWEDKV